MANVIFRQEVLFIDIPFRAISRDMLPGAPELRQGKLIVGIDDIDDTGIQPGFTDMAGIRMRELFTFIESVEPGREAPIERGIEAMLRTHRGRGACLIVSDFMTDGDLNAPLNRVFGAGLELFAVQVLSPAELDPPLTSDHRLVDSETDATVDVACYLRLDGKAPWTSDPDATPGFRRVQRSGGNDRPFALGWHGSQLEARFVVVYRSGCFDPVTHLAHGYKTTPKVKDVRVEYEGQGVILSERVDDR